MEDQINHLAVLPFRLGDLVDVLLVKSEASSGWRLPGGPSRKGLPQYESAAREAKRQVGLVGQIYKRPLRSAGRVRRVKIFPLLVQIESQLATDSRTTARWFPLQEAAQMVDLDFRDAIDAFAQRIERRAY
jgi:ADP-ribose pyrophosphatase YjhB (NUDIX family)